MRLVGVICEYNPFHLGHAWHLAETRRITGADAVVAVLSTAFTQRGEAALLSPAARAEMALRGGADAVIALPALHAVRDAEHFAKSGVALLAGLGCDTISFGAECADLDRLKTIAQEIDYPSAGFGSALKAALARGVPHAAAVREAAEALYPGAGAILAYPNNQLAVAYLRAIGALQAPLTPVVIPRTSAHAAEALHANRLPSAGAVRTAFRRGDWSAVLSALPAASGEILRREALAGRVPDPRRLDAAALYRLRTMTDSEWRSLPGLSEGIENRLRKAAAGSQTVPGLIEKAATRRYPAARLRRMVAHALLGITQEDCDLEPLPVSALLLGLRRDAGALTARLRDAAIPLRVKSSDPALASEAWFQAERRAMDVWALAAGLPQGTLFTQGVVTVSAS